MQGPSTSTNKSSRPSLTPLPPTQYDISDWLLQCLMACNIQQAFGLPGAAIEPLYNAFGRAQRNIKNPPNLVTVKHENAAAIAAEGYYRVTGKMAICCATAGPGTTNLVTGLASAKLERTPIMVITGQTKLQDFARGSFQDSSRTGLDTVSLLEKVCRYSCMVTHPDQLIHRLYTALSLALGDSPGPVHLSIPIDVMRTPLSDVHLPDPEYFFNSLPQSQHTIADNTLKKITNLLEHHRQPSMFIIGPGCQNAIDGILKISEQYHWPMVATPNAKGLIDHDHPLFQGIIGFGGHKHAYNALMATRGLIFMLGTPFDEASTGGWDTNQLPYDRVVQIDQNPQNLYCYLPAHVRALCNINYFIERLNSALIKTITPPSLPVNYPEREKSHKPVYLQDNHWLTIQNPTRTDLIKPQSFIWRLNELAGRQTPICADSSSPFMWSIHLWHSQPKSRGSTTNNFHLAMTLATMGWAISAAVGIAQALKELGDPSPCLCITGDGSYLMSSQEIATAAQLNLNIAFFILNNKSYSIVEHCQRLVGAEQIAFELPNADYCKIAQAFQVPSFKIHDIPSLNQAWKEFSAIQGPALFDVLVDPDVVPPLGHRLESLGFASHLKKEAT